MNHFDFVSDEMHRSIRDAFVAWTFSGQTVSVEKVFKPLDALFY